MTVKLPVTGPTAVGRKLTDRLQDLPAASVAGATGQLPRVAVNGPVVVTGLVAANSSAPGPLFCTLTFCARVRADGAATEVGRGRQRDGGRTTGVRPCPVRVISVGEPAALWVTLS